MVIEALTLPAAAQRGGKAMKIMVMVLACCLPGDLLFLFPYHHHHGP